MKGEDQGNSIAALSGWRRGETRSPGNTGNASEGSVILGRILQLVFCLQGKKGNNGIVMDWPKSHTVGRTEITCKSDICPEFCQSGM